VLDVFVSEGDWVDAGAPLYTIDSTDAEDAVTKAEDAVRDIQKQIDAVNKQLAALNVQAEDTALRLITVFFDGTLLQDEQLQLDFATGTKVEEQI